MRTLVIVMILLTASFALPGLEAQGQSGGAGAGRDAAANRTAESPGAAARGMAEEERAEWQALSADARARGLARAEQARLFAGFNASGDEVTGRFVSFNLSNGSVSDYTVAFGANATTFFSSIEAPAFEADEPLRVAGATLRLIGANATLAVHNNPAAILAYRSGNASLDVTFVPADNATIVLDSNRTALVAAGSVHGHIILQGEGAIANGTSGGVTVSLANDSGVMFVAHPQQSLLGANLHDLRDAASRGRVGGILSVVAVDDEPLQDRVDLGVRLRATEVSQGRATINVSSNETGPRAVVLNLDTSVVNATGAQRVSVLLDGQEIPAAASAVAALNASQATYHANASAVGLQVIVNIPSFSDHEIVVLAPSESGTGTGGTGGTTDGSGTGGTGGSTGTDGATDGSTGGTTPTPTASGDGANETPAAPLALLLAALGLLALARRRR